MDPFYSIPGFIVLTVVGIAVFVRMATSPIRGAHHVYKAISPKANSADKEESKEILKDTGTQISSYLGFLFSFLVLCLAGGLVAMLDLPYAINLILGIGGAVLLFFSFNFFQNRLP